MNFWILFVLRKGFSDKYRNVDALIVDDMQFIAGKEAAAKKYPYS